MESIAKSCIKVSVVIPVYNTQAYVQQAIDSIRHQTLQEIEIIVINDGSTDESLSLIEQLADSDNRIRVFSQPNQGLSVSRNNGVSCAKGEYVYFMDSDDLLEKDALALCYAKCEEDGLDFAFFDATIFYDGEGGFRPDLSLEYNHTAPVGNGVFRGIDAFRMQVEQGKFTPSVCLSFIRRELIERHRLRFMPGIIHEDQLFTTQLYLVAKKTAGIGRAFFHRRLRQNSIMTNGFSWKNIHGYLSVTNALLQFKAAAVSAEQRLAIDTFLTQMLDAAVWQAYVLPLPQRLKLLALCFRRPYRDYVSYRSRAAMLAKAMVG